MKKLSRLHINPERIMKVEELKLLKGGEQFMCCVFWGGGTTFCGPTGDFPSPLQAEDECNQTYIPMGAYCRCW